MVVSMFVPQNWALLHYQDYTLLARNSLQQLHMVRWRACLRGGCCPVGSALGLPDLRIDQPTNAPTNRTEPTHSPPPPLSPPKNSKGDVLHHVLRPRRRGPSRPPPPGADAPQFGVFLHRGDLLRVGPVGVGRGVRGVGNVGSRGAGHG